MIHINKIQYTEKYNPHFRPIVHKQVTTVEISPTGSGKTFFYKDAPNTIMLMPTNTMVRQNAGMVSEEKATGSERYKWDELDTSKCDYMTYDKFHGHSLHQNMSNLNIIVDEAHLVLASMSDVHYDMLDRLFNRKFKYKELKFISATLRPEILDIYDFRPNEPLQVNQYINLNHQPKIQFTETIPNVAEYDEELDSWHFIKTLFFINSMDKIMQVKKVYEARSPDIKIVIISAEDPPPNVFELVGVHIILATSVLKQGFSLEYEVDQVIIHNVYNPVGAMDIIQYMARPRYNQPDIYVIPASTHFSVKEKDMFSVPEVSHLLSEVAQKGVLSTQQYQANNAIGMDEFLARAKTSKSGWNILGVTNYYEYLLTYSELYTKSGIHMKRSILEVIPSATVTFKNIEENASHKLKFSVLKLTEETKTLLEGSKNITELRTNLDTVISQTTDERLLKKLEKYKKNAKNVLIDFKMHEKGKTHPVSYAFTDACQVAQALDDKVRSKCKQHIKNIEKNVYDYRTKHDQRYVPQLGEILLVSKLGRKLNFLRNFFAGGISDIDLLDKLYCFKRFDDEGEELTKRSNKNVYEIEITSIYCVETSWYYKSNIFLKVGIFVI